MNSSQSDFIHSYPPPRNQKHLLIPNSQDWWLSLWFLELFEQAQCCKICISQAFHGRRTRVTLMSYDFRPVTVLACVYSLGTLYDTGGITQQLFIQSLNTTSEALNAVFPGKILTSTSQSTVSIFTSRHPSFSLPSSGQVRCYLIISTIPSIIFIVTNRSLAQDQGPYLHIK